MEANVGGVSDRLTFGPVEFKPQDRYLTAEGYPLGTTCHYVRVEAFGLVRLCCGDTPAGAWRAAGEFAAEQTADYVRRKAEA